MENTAQEELKAHLMEIDDDFRELCDQHSEYDRQIRKLEAKRAHSEQDLMEEARLKKLKLQLKDQITDKLERHKPQPVN